VLIGLDLLYDELTDDAFFGDESPGATDGFPSAPADGA
jgi:hypothetical protein